MDKNQELELMKPNTGDLDVRREPTVADMLRSLLNSPEALKNVAAVEQMVKLYEHMEERNAEKEFARAFVDLQADMPKVSATRAVPNNDGSVRYRFAPFEEIMDQVAPLLKKHGFTVTFSTDFKEGRMIKLCTLQHTGGHSKATSFAVRIGSGPPKASEAQADGAASTYAKRFALVDALNIRVAGLDSDAANEGTAITPEQAKDLSDRLTRIGVDHAAFLKFAGSQSFSEISSVKLEMLSEFVAKKERIYCQKNNL